MGDIEARIWVGYLSESDFFDNNTKNDHTMFHGLAFSYAPSFLPGLTLSVNRVCLVPWEWDNLKYMFPDDSNTYEDQKVSFSASYFLPLAGINVYGELGVDDYVVPKEIAYIRYPFHTMTYLVGLRKTIKIKPDRHVYGEWFFEWADMEMSQDFQYQWPYTFYFHHNIVHGYTNRGQLIGSGIGPGGNSQFLGFKIYYPKGDSLFFIHRFNPDNNFINKEMVDKIAKDTAYGAKYYYSWKANLVLGINSTYFITNRLKISGGLNYNIILNQNFYFDKNDYGSDKILHNFSFQAGLMFSI
jgi:hypothetical protein